MLTPGPLLSLLVVVVLMTASNATAQAPDFVTASYNLDRAYAVVTLNGFPILNDSSRYGMGGGQPVNLHLVPTGNRLEIQFQPQIPADSAEYAVFDIALHSSQQGDMVGTDEVGDLVNVMLDGTGGPQTVVETFDLPEAWRDQFTTGRFYQEAPVVEEQDEITAYALTLIGMLAEGDYAGFAREAQPRMQAYRAAHPAANLPAGDAELEALFAQTLEGLGSMALNTDINAGNLAPVPWAGGRVWELRLADGKPLVYATDDEGGAMSVEVFIGRVDGALRVVR